MSSVAERLGEEIGTTRGGVGVWPALLAVLAAGLIGLLPTFATLGDKWVDSYSYSHGLLVAAICLWLLWQIRAAIAATEARGSLLALAALAGALFLWTLSWAASVEIGTEALFPAALWLAAAALLGLAGAWKLAFPIGYLYFAVPLWDTINSTLQGWTTAVVGVLLPMLHVPAYIVGNNVQIPAGWFEIAGGCSGLHFFIVALALAALYGYLYYGHWSNRLKLLAIAGVGALVINWVRVTTIITAGHLTEMQSYLVKVDHYTFGWVLFGIALIPFYIVARRLERNDPGPRREPPAGARAGRVPMGRLALVCLMLLAPALLWLRPVPDAAGVALTLPAVPGWEGPQDPTTGWVPKFNHADVAVRGAYTRAGATVDAYVNWYATQAQGREVVGYGNYVEGDWPVVSRAARGLELDRGDALPVREIIIRSPTDERRVVWSFYRIGRQAEISPLRAKLIGGWQVMTGRHGAGIVAASSACEGDCDAARARVAAWLSAAAAPLDTELDAAAGVAAGN
jgi:exosortase A